MSAAFTCSVSPAPARRQSREPLHLAGTQNCVVTAALAASSCQTGSPFQDGCGCGWLARQRMRCIWQRGRVMIIMSSMSSMDIRRICVRLPKCKDSRLRRPLKYGDFSILHAFVSSLLATALSLPAQASSVKLLETTQDPTKHRTKATNFKVQGSPFVSAGGSAAFHTDFASTMEAGSNELLRKAQPLGTLRCKAQPGDQHTASRSRFTNPGKRQAVEQQSHISPD